MRGISFIASYSRYDGNSNLDFFIIIYMLTLVKFRVITVECVSRFCCMLSRIDPNPMLVIIMLLRKVIIVVYIMRLCAY
jgi:hypothetical protein